MQLIGDVMNKQVRNNKRKVWRKTYGKAFKTLISIDCDDILMNFIVNTLNDCAPIDRGFIKK